ncbi:MAG: retron St85 family effector protein [Paraglaciecola sp.]|uniref:Uncharacterized protein n=1 Tax=Paraglaciecola agarilytica NO2 TaxID=1125747 RepID=A0ABQ0I0M3_9ALTE|nr:retron St85 family effector protein [Paraglaciecola agarilytica]GAC02869.1 hypothetical protein GAGA_0004 [Paraglaciecola agarilytica NO2]
MEIELRDKDLKQIAKIVKERIFIPRSEKKVTVFLCGGEISNQSNARSKMATIFSKYPRYELLYPEDLFDDLLAGQGQHSLLKLENILADSVDAIVLFPESPGSFAELGAFSNNKELAKKMVVVANKKFKSDKSFINYGPNRLIKSSKTGKITNINYDQLSDDSEQNKIYRRVNDYVIQIKQEHPVEKNVANILEAEHFILPCIYLLDRVSNIRLYKLIGFATLQDDSMCEIATRSALGRLAQKRFITKGSSGYKVTKLGAEYVRKTFHSVYLDKARIELLNAENRGNSMVCYDRIDK